MLDAFFKQLKHPDAAVRLKAAEELGRLEDERALGPLEVVFKCDPDPAVRAAARAAGLRIWQAKRARAQARQRPSPTPVDEDALAAQIVADAMDRNQPAPSLKAETLGVIGMGMLFNPPLAMLGMLRQQYQEIQRETQSQQELDYHRRVSQAMLDRHPAPDEPPPPAEPPPASDAPDAGSGKDSAIRRIAPLQD